MFYKGDNRLKLSRALVMKIMIDERWQCPRSLDVEMVLYPVKAGKGVLSSSSPVLHLTTFEALKFDGGVQPRNILQNTMTYVRLL